MTNPTAHYFIVQCIRDVFSLDSRANAQPIPSIDDWESIAQYAEENAVAPLLYASLIRAPRIACPPAVAERLRLNFLHAGIANWLALRKLESLIAEFERAQIPVIVLKGGALATTLYPEPALRPMNDLDLLIPRVQFEQADRFLCAHGYTVPVDLAENYAPRWANYRAYLRGGNDPAHLEIHWHLFKSPYYWQRVPMAWFWARTVETQIQKRAVRVFTPEAQFVHLTAHFALHHRAERLIWSYDIALLLARESARMDWDMIADAADRFGLTPALKLALDSTARTWDVCAPPDFLARLNASKADWRDRAAFAVMTAPNGTARFLLDTLTQPGIADRVRLVGYHILPARAYMRERYPNGAGKNIVPLYWARWIEGAKRLLHSLVTLRQK